MILGEHAAADLDDIDLHLLDLIQEDCRTSLVRLGEQVGLSAPARWSTAVASGSTSPPSSG